MPDTPSSRERILEAALELMAEHGYDGMSLQMVADRVGLHKSSLFHHFRQKDQLAHEVFGRVAERLRKRIEPYLTVDPPHLEQLLEASDAMVDHFAEDRGAARFLMRAMVANLDSGIETPAADNDFARLLVGIGEWLDRARRAGVIRGVRVRQTLVSLLGLALFYPSIAHDIGWRFLGRDPASPETLAVRKRELRAFLRGALAPG